jgi:hypothetical protein
MTPADEFTRRLDRLAAAATEYRAAAIDFGEWFATRMLHGGGLMASENAPLLRLVESLSTVETLAKLMEVTSRGIRRMSALLPMLFISAEVAHGRARVQAALEAGIFAAQADCTCSECVKDRGAGVEAAVEIARRASGAP